MNTKQILLKTESPDTEETEHIFGFGGTRKCAVNGKGGAQRGPKMTSGLYDVFR